MSVEISRRISWRWIVVVVVVVITRFLVVVFAQVWVCVLNTIIQNGHNYATSRDTSLPNRNHVNIVTFAY